MKPSDVIQPDKVSGNPFVFVSYSHRDAQKVQELFRLLRQNCFRFWYDEGIKSGTEWAEELGNNIAHCEQFLLFLTPNAVRSKYVRKEIGMAVQRDKNLLILYWDETELTDGLSLLLGDINAIHRANFVSAERFEQALRDAISPLTLYRKSSRKTDRKSNRQGETAWQHFRAELLSQDFPLKDSYRLISLIGEGGTAEVYLAESKSGGLPVAIKQGFVDGYRGAFLRKCLLSEISILKALRLQGCPNVPVLLDFYEDPSQVILVETLVPGESLQQLQRKKSRYSEKEIVSIARQVLVILRNLHQMGIIYRDIKPGNLMMDSLGNIHLIDFGIALYERDASDSDPPLGTRDYAAPEQFLSNTRLSPSTDLYALGKTLRFLLKPELLERSYESIRIARPDISAGLVNIIDRMTSEYSHQRFASADDVLTALENYPHYLPLRKAYLWTKMWVRGVSNLIAYWRKEEKNKKLLNITTTSLLTGPMTKASPATDTVILK